MHRKFKKLTLGGGQAYYGAVVVKYSGPHTA